MSKPVQRRRKHKNSKMGCANCKKRKVKCLEDLPECRNCVKHKVRCGYLDYTDAQKAELRNSKFAQEFKQLTTVPLNESIASTNSVGSPDSHKPTPAFPLLRKRLSHANEHLRYQVHHHNIKQNFDNLMPLATSVDMTYPVYTIHEHANQETTQSPPIEAQPRSFKLPNGVQQVATFKVWNNPYSRKFYVDKFDEDVAAYSRSIATGTNSIFDVRYLYFLWLLLFTNRAYSSQLYFSCLLNLTINYLICNLFTSSIKYREAIANSALENNQHYLDQTKTKDVIIMRLIEHYANIIKRLRLLLNERQHPDLAAQVSFVLSVMSVYDPEATLHSLNCFRDGLFSILTYHFNRSAATKEELFFIPLHLQLMKNSMKLVYFPATLILTLHEFLHFLRHFVSLVEPYLTRPQETTDDVSQEENKDCGYAFIHLKLLDLLEFVTDVVEIYYDEVNDNLDDMQTQQETLFRMMYKWVRFFPSQLLLLHRGRLPLFTLTYLFYQTAKIKLYALFPQVKFFFLRDFALPIMLDVFIIPPKEFHEVWNHHLELTRFDLIPSQEYSINIAPQIKFTAAYLIRCIQYYQDRLKLLYKLVLELALTFPIENVKKWRDAITDVAAQRQFFSDNTGLRERSIRFFSEAHIRQENYPLVYGEQETNMFEDDDQAPDLPEDFFFNVNVDYSTLQTNGLLREDWSPF